MNPAPASAADALRRQRPWLLATLLIYAIIQFLYLTATPLQVITLPDNLPPQNGEPQSVLTGIGPDEKEYLVYIRSLSESGRLPAPSPRYRKSPDEYVSYQAQHPPLFFLLGSLIEKVGVSHSPAVEWYLLRGLCVVFGAVVVWLTAMSAAWAFPDRAFIVCAAPPLAAFLPMFGHMTANVSNEPMAMALTAWAWLQMVQMVRRDTQPTVRDAAFLGLTLGVACLTRLTAIMWLPAVLLCVWFAASRNGKTARTFPLMALAGGIVLALAAIWLVRNQFVYGSALVRTFERPILDGGLTLGQYLANTNQPLTIRGQQGTLVITPLYTVLWYASTAWFPYWLVQFYLPGGLRAAPAFQAIALIGTVVIGLLLFLNASRASREKERGDPGGRVLLWAAGITLGFCVLVLLQQQLYSDWNVVNSPGRYIVAAIPATTLLLSFALSTKVRPDASAARGAAIGAAVLMLLFDVYVAVLVRQFYVANPTQPSVQPIEQPGDAV